MKILTLTLILVSFMIFNLSCVENNQANKNDNQSNQTQNNNKQQADDGEAPIIPLITPTNLSKDLKTAALKNQTIMMMFSGEHCSFCETLAREILRPMQIVQKDSNYIIRRLDNDPSISLIDFDGKPVTADKFFDRYNISVTPTLLFFDHTGKEAAQRIVGVNGTELLSYYIDSSIDLVSQKIAKATVK